MDAIVIWRGVLIAVGVVLLGLGGLVLIRDVPLTSLPGLIAWLGGAILLHDGVGAMAVFSVAVVARRVGRRVPFVVIVILEAALAVGAIVTVLVLPEIVKHEIGSANPSILPLDYLRNLLLFHAGLAAVTVSAVAFALGRRRSKQRAKPV